MSYSILIADDEAEIRNLLRLYLENEHYNIIEAADGQQALDALQSHHIDLCILDIMMPKVDGFHVLQEMRQKSNIPVIILSAKDADSEKILGTILAASFGYSMFSENLPATFALALLAGLVLGAILQVIYRFDAMAWKKRFVCNLLLTAIGHKSTNR